MDARRLRSPRPALLVCTALVLAACGAAPGGPVPTAAGPDATDPALSAQATGKNLVLVGGGLKDDNAAVYNRIVELAGGRGVARIGIITAASVPPSQDPDAGTANASNSRDNAAYYANLFKTTYGALDAQFIPIDLDTISNNSSPAVVNQINAMTGFFFGGGDQARLIQTFFLSGRQDSPALAAIRNRFAAGAVVAGSSAGTAVQAGVPMITGGESYDALRYGSYGTPSASHPDDLTYDALGGFNLFRVGLLDTHFAERGRQGRLARLAADRNVKLAFGVDENTALVVTNADTASANMTVLGTGGVTILDLNGATVGTGTSWSLSNVTAHYLTAGDAFNPATRAVGFAAGKTAMAGRETYSSPLSPTRDLFSSPNNSTSAGRRNPREFVRIATDLFDSRGTSTTGQTYETNPTFEARLTKTSASAGYKGTVNGVTSLSYRNLKVDLYRR